MDNKDTKTLEIKKKTREPLLMSDSNSQETELDSQSSSSIEENLNRSGVENENSITLPLETINSLNAVQLTSDAKDLIKILENQRSAMERVAKNKIKDIEVAHKCERAEWQSQNDQLAKEFNERLEANNKEAEQNKTALHHQYKKTVNDLNASHKAELGEFIKVSKPVVDLLPKEEKTSLMGSIFSIITYPLKAPYYAIGNLVKMTGNGIKALGNLAFLAGMSAVGIKIAEKFESLPGILSPAVQFIDSNIAQAKEVFSTSIKPVIENGVSVAVDSFENNKNQYYIANFVGCAVLSGTAAWGLNRHLNNCLAAKQKIKKVNKYKELITLTEEKLKENQAARA